MHEILKNAPPLELPGIDFTVIALVAGQENYGFAIVALGEAIWSFSQAPSLSHTKILVPAIVAFGLLVGVSGPIVTNASDPESIRITFLMEGNLLVEYDECYSRE